MKKEASVVICLKNDYQTKLYFDIEGVTYSGFKGMIGEYDNEGLMVPYKIR